MPINEIRQRIAKLKEVKQSIDDCQLNLDGYMEKLNELIDWAEHECETLIEQVALHKADREEKVYPLQHSPEPVKRLSVEDLERMMKTPTYLGTVVPDEDGNKTLK